MTGNTQKLSIRLLKNSIKPEDSLRNPEELKDLNQVEGAKIIFGTSGCKPPKWSEFLKLNENEKKELINLYSYGLLFINASNRWFAISFGAAHHKINPETIEQDFGLKVVLNSVDPDKLRSADIRTPDENTLLRRSQTSRETDQRAFLIDYEKDIVRGVAGIPKDKNFASRVSGSDALVIDTKTTVDELKDICGNIYLKYQEKSYEDNFDWIDQIKHIRDDATIEQLNTLAIERMNEAISGSPPESLHLSFPIIYDPEKINFIQYKGFRSKLIYPTLDLAGYLNSLKEAGKSAFKNTDLEGHTIHEVDEDGNPCGGRWKLSQCISIEVESDGNLYVLSGGRWYGVSKTLSEEVQKFFESAIKYEMPDAKENENEESYNARLKLENKEIICLDRKLVSPSNSKTRIEICDFLSKDKHLIHIKDKTSSSRLSHLFNQGTVSGRTLILDGQSRNQIREKIKEIQDPASTHDFLELIPDSESDFAAREFTVVYAVIGEADFAKLPFFSQVTFRQAANELRALGFSVKFSWIKKEKTKSIGKKLKSHPTTEPEPEPA